MKIVKLSDFEKSVYQDKRDLLLKMLDIIETLLCDGGDVAYECDSRGVSTKSFKDFIGCDFGIKSVDYDTIEHSVFSSWQEEFINDLLGSTDYGFNRISIDSMSDL